MSNFSLVFDALSDVNGLLSTASSDIGSCTGRLNSQASRLSSMSGFGIPALRNMINDAARATQRLGNEVKDLSDFVTKLDESTRRHEDLAFMELSGGTEGTRNNSVASSEVQAAIDRIRELVFNNPTLNMVQLLAQELQSLFPNGLSVDDIMAISLSQFLTPPSFAAVTQVAWASDGEERQNLLQMLGDAGGQIADRITIEEILGRPGNTSTWLTIISGGMSAFGAGISVIQEGGSSADATRAFAGEVVNQTARYAAGATGQAIGKAIGTAIGTYFAGVGAAPGAAIGSCIGYVAGVLIYDHGDTIYNWVCRGAEAVGDWVNQAVDWGADAARNFTDAAGSAFQTVGEIASDLRDIAGDAFRDIGSTLRGAAGRAWNVIVGQD